MNADEQNSVLRRVGDQRLLFPELPRELCQKHGLNWWAALKLHEDGLLSFNPADVQDMDEGQEAELRFLAALITGGCDPYMLDRLLASLPKPFKYRHDAIYYDWQAKRWRPMPEPEEPAVVFDDWLETLTKEGDEDTLESLRHQIDDALESIREPSE